VDRRAGRREGAGADRRGSRRPVPQPVRPLDPAPAATDVDVASGLPTTPQLPQLGGAVQGKTDAKTVGFYGPQPPLGHGVHHYHFQVFALDITLLKGPEATVADLSAMMKGHVLADGEVVGTYEMAG
jgi:Raf kinase inhibitor-like YbhB/YbcL family protein